MFCMRGRALMVWMLLAAPLVVASGGCFLVPSAPRPDPKAPIAGPLPYAEGCETCHAPVLAQYAQSLHAAKGIRCGQCHTPGDHPNFAQPIQDGKCGGCHQPQYQEALSSKHFATREQRNLNADPAARTTLRQEGFTAPAASGGRRFVGDAAAGELGGRLCVACHYDEHRLGLATVRQPTFCTSCHGGREDHFADPTASASTTNRCMECHVRVGKTLGGQIVNTHRFARPGAERTGG
jgi:hypothetical protein